MMTISRTISSTMTSVVRSRPPPNASPKTLRTRGMALPMTGRPGSSTLGGVDNAAGSSVGVEVGVEAGVGVGVGVVVGVCVGVAVGIGVGETASRWAWVWA